MQNQTATATVTTQRLSDIFKAVYYNPENSGAYCGVEQLVRNVYTKLGGRISLKRIRKAAKEWVKSQDTYTLHRPIRRKFHRNPTVVYGIDDQWQADLVDMQQWRKENRGYAHLLTCIDVFSKYAWVRPLKSKGSLDVANAFSSIFKQPATATTATAATAARFPRCIQTDKGKEFLNRQVQSVFNDYEIEHFTTENNETKAAVVERFNRTLKSRMWRYFTEMGNHQYYDILQKLVTAYNNSVHRTIGMAPNKVTGDYEKMLWNKMYGSNTNTISNSTLFKFDMGAQVRLSKLKWNFEKGYLPNWTDEVFIIEKRYLTHPKRVYKLKDIQGEVVSGTFYEDELQEVEKDLHTGAYEVERVIDQRLNEETSENEILVKWKGWPDKFNEWILESELN
jgi:transposase InsO family protein